ncbi:MAG: adenylate kinase [Rhodothermales bacterium]|nr:adenylate kinase [Rhodothermales bacterium]MBO6781440.1 adenylate kinase [Rhodothermales bacterium]
MRIVLFGPPGVGKGSQAALLQERRGMAHVSTGILLRTAIRQGTDVGKAAERMVKEGKLVPDAVVRKIAEDALLGRDCDQFALDGYPRTIQQAEWLSEFLEAHKAPLNRVISLNAPDEVIVDRLSKRRVDRVTRENYHLDFKPPPDDLPEGRIIQRADDKPEIILRRLKQYREETSPVQEYYRDRGMLSEVYGVGAFEDVHATILDILESSRATA